jgi:hypothetical protein
METYTNLGARMCPVMVQPFTKTVLPESLSQEQVRIGRQSNQLYKFLQYAWMHKISRQSY